MFQRRIWLGIILITIIVLSLTMIVLSFIPGRHAGRSVLSELFGIKPPSVRVSELNFDVGRNRYFAHSDGCVAAVGTLGLQVLGPDGRETLRDSYRQESPAIAENSGRFIAYDIGGTAVRIFNAEQIIYSLEAEAPVVSATINKNGWFCLVMQENLAGSRGTVYVYNNTGKPVYRVTLGSGFVVSAVLSDNNNNLAILNLAETGSRVTLYSGIDEDKDYPDGVYELGNEVFFDFGFVDQSRCIVFGKETLLIIDFLSANPVKPLYTFEGKLLGGYTYSDSFAALHLYDYNIGYTGQIITINYLGTVLGQHDVNTEVTSVSSFGDTIVTLGSDGVIFYDKTLRVYPPAESTISVNTSGHIYALNENMALNAGDLSAIIVRREAGNR